MEPGSLLLLLLVLACPLLMVWMMRGGHGGHGGHGHTMHGEGHGHMHAGGGETPAGSSLDELRARRAELDTVIAQLEDEEVETKTPHAV